MLAMGRLAIFTFCSSFSTKRVCVARPSTMVKFGLRLLSSIHPQWSDSYVEYNLLKKQIRLLNEKIAANSNDTTVEQKGNEEFVTELSNNVRRAEDFFSAKLRQLGNLFDVLVEKAAASSSSHKVELSVQRGDLVKLYIELSCLREFGTLNYTAVSKILKKHDKYLPSNPLKAEFMKQQVDHLTVFGTHDSLNKLATKVRNYYAEVFEDGNRHHADEILSDAVKLDSRSKEHRGPEGIPLKKCFILDMDGVVYHGDRLLPSVVEFVRWMEQSNKRYLFLTNGSVRTPPEIQAKLKRLGLDVGPDVFHTSAISTAMFLQSQTPNGSAYVIGDNGIVSALNDVGFTITDVNPDYVVVGETRDYNFDKIEKAINLVFKGARLIGTNCDAVDNATIGFTPSCGALCAPIEKATGKQAYFVGKPNALMFRTAAIKLKADPSDCVMIGDRMDTDIIGGIEAGMDTILVLTGITKLEDINNFAYRPTYVLKDLHQIQSILSAFE